MRDFGRNLELGANVNLKAFTLIGIVGINLFRAVLARANTLIRGRRGRLGNRILADPLKSHNIMYSIQSCPPWSV